MDMCKGVKSLIENTPPKYEKELGALCSRLPVWQCELLLRRVVMYFNKGKRK